MDEQTNPITNPVQTHVANPNAPVVPTTPAEPTAEVPGEVSTDIPAGAPAGSTDEQKPAEAPTAPVV